jgi:hypothetical protein
LTKSKSAGVSPLIGLPEITSVPVQVAVMVTAAVVALARIGMVNVCVFVPPAFTVIAAGLAVKVKPV